MPPGRQIWPPGVSARNRSKPACAACRRWRAYATAECSPGPSSRPTVAFRCYRPENNKKCIVDSRQKQLTVAAMNLNTLLSNRRMPSVLQRGDHGGRCRDTQDPIDVALKMGGAKAGVRR